MAGLFLTRNDNPSLAEAAIEIARAQFARHGFTAPVELAFDGWRGLHAHYVSGGPATFLRRGDDFVAVAGTLSCGGLFGEAALGRLLDIAEAPFTDWDEVAGQFVALVVKQGKALIFTDWFGAFQLFHDPDHRILSTSLLSVAQALPRVQWDPQGVYEFAFNVFPTGDDTVFEEIKRLGPERQLRLDRDGAHGLPVAKPLPDDIGEMPIEERVRAHADLLLGLTRPWVDEFGDRIQCPLSGGIDSRLVLALLRASGARPHIYVYGAPGDSDVDVAMAIGAAEGFEVEVTDKGAGRIEPDAFPAIVERNFHETCALVTDGGLFDNGGNSIARHARQAGGQLAVSGACGEVFRNFFYLPDRPMRARDVVHAFFARYARQDVTTAFDPAAFYSAIEDKMLAAIGRPGDRQRLSRTLVEQAYPTLRCRAFFGREASLVGRQGAYYLPFFDQRVVAAALELPMRLKYAGAFEAMVMTRIDPALAGHMSSYGHSFADGPDFRHRLSEWSTRIRPPMLRRQSYAIRRWLHPVEDDHGGLLRPAFLGHVIDLNFPLMRRFFHPRQITDSGLYRRVATLEYLGGFLGSRLNA